MLERTFKVKYITLKNCFCYLSDKYSKVIGQGSVCNLTFKSNSYYVSLGGHLFSLKDNEIGFNTIYANVMGLEEDELISFTQCNNLPSVSNVDISPCNKDDFEILELMAENIQNTLLDQIHIVNNNQKIVVWISNSIHIVVEIDGVKPISPGHLEYLTEVAIKASISKEGRNKSAEHVAKWNINNFFKYVKLASPFEEDICTKYDKDNAWFVFRVFSMDLLQDYVNRHNHFDVYTLKDMFPFDVQANNLFKFFPVHLPTESGFVDESVANQKNITVQLRILEGIDSKIRSQHFIPLFINHAVLKYYRLVVGGKIVLCPDKLTGSATKIEILTNTHNAEEMKQQFKNIIAENSTENGILFNSDVTIRTSNNQKMMLKFSPSNLSATFVNSDFIRNGEISVTNHAFVDAEEVSQKIKETEDICLDLTNFKSIFQGCAKCLNTGLTTFQNMEHILIIGKCGTGKSTIAKSFAEKISSQSDYVHVEFVKCKNIKGKSLDSLHKLLTNTFLKLIYYQPSLLILDDIDIICQKVIEGDATTQESLLFNKVSEMLVDLLEQYLVNNIIMVLATAQTTTNLNKHLFMSRGNHLFKNVFHISDLNKNDRNTFIKLAFSKYNISEDIDFDYLSVKSEGFVIQDMMDLVDKCVFESFKEDVQSISWQHCLNALHTSSSLSLRNVELHSPGDRDFSDVGGLEDAKKVLIENMMWPLQYTNIFGNSPLRLQSGLLLYGPPGTGKTILAGAAAKQCGLRLISVKGPELLSKYIGASEQAVRDIFQKAQSAKPCILFFDEFDSLAPRRGHDNTGVTDRVVNQFLTQLDGIESLTGVCVLAATSRPDLLDPALLRPGRLDQKILCSLPTKEGRLLILRALSKNLNFAEDVNLDEIARVTGGFSGADLQGVLYTAQLNAMEDFLSGTQSEADISDTRTEIDQNQLERAVKNTRPSLTKEERLKYDRIYAKFEGKLDVNEIRAGKQRATLA